MFGIFFSNCFFIIHLSGDKENHKPVLHFAMLSHSLVLLSATVAPFALLDLFDLLSPKTTPAVPGKRPKSGYIRLLKNVLFCIVVSGVVSYMLVVKSYGHPFLESDNRYVVELFERILKYLSLYDSLRLF